MKKIILFLIISLVTSVSLLSFGDEVPLSARTASYLMQLRLDTEKHQVTAEQTVYFNNPSDDTIFTMPFHMYYNAFKNNQTTFFTGASRIPRSKSQEDIDNCAWGWIEVLKVTDEAGNDLSKNMAYVQYDDGNPNDHTVLEIRLKEPILPRGSYTLKMKWKSQIPKIIARTGYANDFYFMAQWYPKLGVYEPAGSRFAEEGQWNCHQYHPITEYFGEFGNYTISIDVPQRFKVGASGALARKEQKEDRIIYTYIATDVIDFTWTAKPDFLEVIDNWKGVQLRLLIMPEHEHQKNRFLDAAKHSLDFYEEYIEKYPYSTLTIVSPPYYGLAAGAMEYPTLITSPTLSGFPKSIRTTETLVIHELTHQYFMQMLATNEQEEPWLDEGFTAFFEGKIMDKYYPKGVISLDYWNIHIGSEEFRRGRFFSAENIKVNPLSDFGFDFKHGSFGEIAYGKTAVGLRTLEGLVGEEMMKEIIQTYFQTWKFKHPSRKDFINVVKEVVKKTENEELSNIIDSFLEQLIFGTEECDYAVANIQNNLQPEPAGFYKSIEDCEHPEDKTLDVYEAKAVLFRLGEFIVPQVIEVTFDDGSVMTERWDGQARSHEVVYFGSQKIVSVAIDPALKVPLDKNLINNSKTTKTDKSGIVRYVSSTISWLQNIMVTMSAFV